MSAVLNIDSPLMWDPACPVLLPLGTITNSSIISASVGVFVPFLIFTIFFFYYLYSLWVQNIYNGNNIMDNPIFMKRNVVNGGGGHYYPTTTRHGTQSKKFNASDRVMGFHSTPRPKHTGGINEHHIPLHNKLTFHPSRNYNSQSRYDQLGLVSEVNMDGET